MLTSAEKRREFARGVRESANLIGRMKYFSDSERHFAESVIAGLEAYAAAVEQPSATD